MKKIIRRLKEKLRLKGSPPPYRENDGQVDGDNDTLQEHQEFHEPVNVLRSDALDLLANCQSTINSLSEAEYAEIEDMGIWHSTPLSHRNKSKISLTWVLKENLDLTKKLPEKCFGDRTINTNTDRNKEIQRYDYKKKLPEKYVENRTITDRNKDIQRYDYDINRQRLIEIEGNRKCKSQPSRVVGRNEYYHNLRFRNAYEEFLSQNTLSDTSVSTEYVKRKHKHRNRRMKRRQEAKFGYDIRDLDTFLTEATIDRPGNIPVVIAYPTSLHQTHKPNQQELSLPLGTVVNAVFKSQQWLFAQTPHGNEGYVLYSACLPLGILPARPSPQKKTPCWESSTDIYPQPCGNLTDNEKEQLRGRTRSESRYRTKQKKRTSYAEQNFDSLYLKSKSVCSDMDRIGKETDRGSKEVDRDGKEIYRYGKEIERFGKEKPLKLLRQTLLVVTSDFKGSVLNKTLTVAKGDVVVLQSGKDMDDWFYVKKRDGSHGFIPSDVAGHGYI